MDVSLPSALPTAATNGLPRKLLNGRLAEEYYKPFPPNHFAPGPDHRKLQVGIVGAGIAGLAAAVALLQSGHDVEIFEKSKFSNETGAAIQMCPNASRILSYYEFDFTGGNATTLQSGAILNGETLDHMKEIAVPDCQYLYGAPWYLFHRVDLHQGLRKLATQPRPHTPAVAQVRLSSEVTDVDLDGTITFVDGKTVKKDLVVLSDGVHNTLASKVAADEAVYPARPTGNAVYRFLIPCERLLANDRLRRCFADNNSSFFLALTAETRLVWYPCRHGALMNFALFVPDNIEGYDDDVWNIPASFEDFMKSCKSLHPDLQEVCRKAENLKLFRLCMRDKPLSALTRENVVLIGDAAHPMLPHQAQGGAQAVEDGAALGVLFYNFTSKDEVSHRLQLFQRLRQDRVSSIEILSSVGQDQIHKVIDKARPYLKGPIRAGADALNERNFTPNILRDAEELLRNG